jgi:hypothetical protein
MNTTEMKGRITEASPRFPVSGSTKAKITAVFYLVTLVTGLAVLLAPGRVGLVFDLIASVGYVGITVLFYELTR